MNRKLVISAVLLLSYMSFVTAMVPPVINFSGRLTGIDNVPKNGSFSLTFKIYGNESGGSALWTETQNAVAVSNGVFSVLLGSGTALPVLVLENADNRWVEITVGSDVLSPRVRLVSAPFAYLAERAYGVIGSTVTSGNIVDGTIIDSDINASAAIASTKISGLGTLASTNSVSGGTAGTIIDGTIVNADLASGSFSNVTGVGTLGSLTVSGNSYLATTTGNVGIGTTDFTNPVVAPTLVVRAPMQLQADQATCKDMMLRDSTSGEFWTISHRFHSEANNLNIYYYGGTTWDAHLAITTTGYVGIGTTAPVQKMQVEGNIALASIYTAIGNGNARYIGLPGVAGAFPGSAGTYIKFCQGGTGGVSNWLEFGTHKNGVDFGTRMTIAENGYVGIGTTNPVGHAPTRRTLVLADTTNDALFEIWGSNSGKAVMQSVGGNTYFGNMGQAAGAVYAMYGAGTTGATLNSTGGWAAGCSKELKQDIKQLTDDDFVALRQEFFNIPLYSYERKDKPGSPEVGFISEYTPEVVGSDGKNIVTLKTVGYLSTIVKGQEIVIKQQDDKIKLLETKINELEQLIKSR
jgi:hypothetical protein